MNLKHIDMLRVVLRLTGVSALSVDVYPDRNSITWMDFVSVPSQRQIQTSKTIILSIWILLGYLTQLGVIWKRGLLSKNLLFIQ